MLRILGTDSLPLHVETECELRLRMYHAAGHNGPLPIIGLIDLVRSLGLAPPPRASELKPAAFDWHDVPQDGTFRIEAYFFGSWIPGWFRGFVAHGMLAIKLDSDEFVKEVRKDVVRPAAVQSPPVDNVSTPKPLAAVLAEAADVAIIQIQEPAPVAIIKPSKAIGLAPVPKTGEDNYVPPQAMVWSGVPLGAEVWADVDDDIQSGTLHAVTEIGERVVLSVLIGDSVVEVNASLVTLAA